MLGKNGTSGDMSSYYKNISSVYNLLEVTEKIKETFMDTEHIESRCFHIGMVTY